MCLDVIPLLTGDGNNADAWDGREWRRILTGDDNRRWWVNLNSVHINAMNYKTGPHTHTNTHTHHHHHHHRLAIIHFHHEPNFSSAPNFYIFHNSSFRSEIHNLAEIGKILWISRKYLVLTHNMLSTAKVSKRQVDQGGFCCTSQKNSIYKRCPVNPSNCKTSDAASMMMMTIEGWSKPLLL